MVKVLIWKHICLDKLFLLFVLFIILTGNFNYFIPYFLLLLIHEIGHALMGISLGYEIKKIVFYPLGGITIFNLPLNIPLNNELLILLMGPIMQIIGYYILRCFFPFISIYHYTLLIFNLLPIYPLDGGKILNIVLGYQINYLKSFYMTFTVSFFVLSFLLIKIIISFNLNLFFMIIFLFLKLIKTYQKRYWYYNRFLLERYIYEYHFKKIKNISSIQDFYRDRKHFIHFQEERNVLRNYFSNHK